MKIHHVWMDDDIDCYSFYTTKLGRPIEDWEGHDIIEINSIYHFFECVNTEDDGIQDIFLELMELYEAGEIPAINLTFED